MGDDAVSSFKLLIQTIVAFIVVLFLLLLFLKWMGRWNQRQQTTSLLRLVARIQLDQKHAVCLIEAAGQFYLLGVGGDVHLLAEVKDEKQIGLINAFKLGQQNQEGFFTHLLKARLAEVMQKKQSGHDALSSDRQGWDDDA